MAIIALENIRKSYADGNQMHHVLNQLNLSVEPNEFVAILGPSGSGKSTLLAIAGLLLSADEGRIRIAGQDLTGLNQGQWTQKRLELLGFIFQDHQLLSYMKIGDQLELVAKLKGEKDKRKGQEKTPRGSQGFVGRSWHRSLLPPISESDVRWTKATGSHCSSLHRKSAGHFSRRTNG